MSVPRLLKIIFVLFLFGNAALFFLLFYPLPKVLMELRPQETVKVYDRNGLLLSEMLSTAKGRQTFVPLSEIPKPLQDAFLSAEDQRYYEHSGLDFTSILRAVWQNVAAGEVVSGGSTITQQLVRNLIGTDRPRSFAQKLKESALALRLSRIHSKDEVFELYLNSIYFGGLAYGVEAASWQYFGKSAHNLGLAESAFLAGLPQAPNRFYPFKHFEAAKQRQETVLEAMLKNKAITDSDFNQAKDEDVVLRPTKIEKKAPHFVDFVIQSSHGDSLISNSKIETTLDLGLQEKVEQILQNQITFLRDRNIENAAAVVLDARTGDILAMVGSADYNNATIQGAVNVATSLRQPGSALKPLVYAAAFEKGWKPDTQIIDEPIQYETPDGLPYSPKNFDLQYHGSVTVAQALAQSLNVPAVKTLDFVGVSSFMRLARDFGITTFGEDATHYGLSLALGSGEVTLLELVNAYGVFANRGNHCPIRFIKTTERSDCLLVARPNSVAAISAILSDNNLRMPEFGEENPLNFGYPVAAKTGTSRNFRDNWTMGYTDDTVVGVWVGNASGEIMEGATGITGAAPIFSKIVNMLHERSGTKLTLDKTIRIPSITEGSIRESSLQGFRIVTPFANDQFLFDPAKPIEVQKVQLKASAEAHWFVDNEPVGVGTEVLWILKRGEHTIRATHEGETREVGIRVR